jgi:predicted metal-dependent hydrolase
VVVPCGATEQAVDELIVAHRDWLVERVGRERRRLEQGQSLGLVRADALPLAGAWVPVERRPVPRALAQVRDGVLVVGGRDQAAARAAVLRWYRREARARVSDAVVREADRLSLAPGPIAVRDQRSRWASCSRSGALSFSWRLVLAPRSVLDYVVVHELCHLVQPNHSPAFWRLVDAARPDWQGDAAWLREHGRELQAFTPLSD